MDRFTSNEEFFSLVGQVADRLRAEGLTAEANSLHRILHETARTTSSELFGELGLAILGAQRRAGASVSPQSAKDIEQCVVVFREV